MSAPELSRTRSKTLTWEDPSISAEALASMPGRELLQAIVDGRLPRPPIASLFGARMTSVGEGVVVFECTPDESTYNPIGLVHGGLLCTLLDSAAGCAVHSLLPAGVGFSSIEIKVSFLSPVTADSGKLVVEGRALRVGRQIAFAEGHARTAAGKLVGHATSSLALMRP
ncbi:MAG TPA: PaaI family thioesterase [Solirubrobacteraceae bacterium]|nr:PaaI family thioesterase [Solirubrobacteraceae bacterium]